MDFEFDSGKDRENRRKHGFSLSLGREILESGGSDMASPTVV